MNENQSPQNRFSQEPIGRGQSEPDMLIREPAYSIEDQIADENNFKSGANWFYWIAGLSLVNSILIFAGAGWGFVVGLGVTQIIDAIAYAIGHTYGTTIPLYLAFVADTLVAGSFIFIGYMARQRKNLAFIAGMALYAADGTLFLMTLDVLGIGFHLLALIFIYRGYQALSKMEQAEKLTASQIPRGVPEEMAR